MLNYDEMLEAKINAVENGQPIENVIASLPEEAKDLAPLIHLAAAVRDMPHPVPEPEKTASQQSQVMAAAKANTSPYPRRPLAKIGWKWLTGAALAGAGVTTIMIFILLAAGLGFWLNSRSQDTARIETIVGQVQVATDKDGTAWKNLAVGDRLRHGQRLRTLGASAATLVFFEGTHTFVSANSDLSLIKLNGSGSESLQVEIYQHSGETWNKVIPLQGEHSFFLVSTPNGTASVHGTSFKVRVNPNGQTQFAVNTGEVRVNNNSARQVTLLSGQVASASQDGEISEAAYQFQVQGSLLAIDEISQVWTVSGTTFQVTSETEISGNPHEGDTIAVTGQIREGNLWVADTIVLAGSSEQNASFTGTIDSKEGAVWTIGGKEVTLNDQTSLDPDLAPGMPVRVTFNTLENGSWLALKIEALVDEPDDPELDPTPTSDPNAKPSYKFVPEVLELSRCETDADYSLNAGIKNVAENAKDYAVNVQLGYLIDRGGEYISTVEINPASIERIDAGQTAPFTIKVTMNADWANAPKDSQVKLQVYIASAANRPDHLNGRLTVTIKAGCDPEETKTVTPTPTATQTVSGTPDPTTTATLGLTPTAESTEEGIQCTGADPHPTGTKLAQRYAVPYEEIMKWFCEYHYGFGEIDLAYSLSRQYARPVEEIFAMRASGMGWGNIKKALANPDGSDQPGEKDKEKGNDKKDKKKP